MTDTMILRIAKAITPDWDHCSNNTRKDAIITARVMLQTAREPDPTLAACHGSATDVARRFMMSEWRPIETAPKDGTLIDVWLGDAALEDVDFYCTPGTRRSPGWCWYRDKWRPKVNSLQIPTFVKPTHWMSLPKPPEAKP